MTSYHYSSSNTLLHTQQRFQSTETLFYAILLFREIQHHLTMTILVAMLVMILTEMLAKH